MTHLLFRVPVKTLSQRASFRPVTTQPPPCPADKPNHSTRSFPICQATQQTCTSVSHCVPILLAWANAHPYSLPFLPKSALSWIANPRSAGVIPHLQTCNYTTLNATTHLPAQTLPTLFSAAPLTTFDTSLPAAFVLLPFLRTNAHQEACASRPTSAPGNCFVFNADSLANKFEKFEEPLTAYSLPLRGKCRRILFTFFAHPLSLHFRRIIHLWLTHGEL